jgi:hypothetical protein
VNEAKREWKAEGKESETFLVVTALLLDFKLER